VKRYFGRSIYYVPDRFKLTQVALCCFTPQIVQAFGTIWVFLDALTGLWWWEWVWITANLVAGITAFLLSGGASLVLQIGAALPGLLLLAGSWGMTVNACIKAG
jgi:hypothetical protein